MKVFITGGTGFVGTTLTQKLAQEGHEVTVLTRSIKTPPALQGISYAEGDPTQKGRWQEKLAAQDVVINLAGAPILKKWSEEYKGEIRSSRIDTTRKIVSAINAATVKPKTFISGSAIGLYREGSGHSEESRDFASGFMGARRKCSYSIGTHAIFQVYINRPCYEGLRR